MARNPNALLITTQWAGTGDSATPESLGLQRTTGWPASYSQAGGPRPQRTLFNQLYKELSALAVEINTNGAGLDWDTSISYVAGALVKGSDDALYIAQQANNALDPTDGANRPANWLSLAEFISNQGGVPTGTIVPTFETGAAPAGWLFLEGSTASRTNYAGLWAWVQARTELLVTDAEWNAGQQGKFSEGDGSTTFRLSDFRGEFLRGHANGSANDPDAASRAGGDTVASKQSFALEQMTGAIAAETGITSVNGVFETGGGTGNNNGVDHVSSSTGSIRFDASNVAQTSTETRSRNIAVRYMIKV